MKPGRSKSLKIKGEFEIMMLGNAAVGKSWLLQRILSDKRPSKGPTIGAETYVKTVLIKNGMIRLNICDSSGEARFKYLQRTYYKQCNGAMVIYDIQNTKSFEEAKEWVEELREKVSHDLVIALTGNKKDLHDNRSVSLAEADAYAKENNLIFFETSALTGQNVESCFMALVNALYSQKRSRPKSSVAPSNLEKKKVRCCGLFCFKNKTTTESFDPCT